MFDFVVYKRRFSHIVDGFIFLRRELLEAWLCGDLLMIPGPQMIPNHKRSPQWTANDHGTHMIPLLDPQMIPTKE